MTHVIPVVPVERLITEILAHSFTVNSRKSKDDGKYHTAALPRDGDGWIKSGPQSSLALSVAIVHREITLKI